MRRVLVLTILLSAAPALAQPVALVEDVALERITTLPSGPIRLAQVPSTGTLFLLTFGGGIVRFEPPYTTGTEVANQGDTGLSATQGLTVGDDGTLYVTGSVPDGVLQSAQVRRAVPDGDGYAWSTVARTEFYTGTDNGYNHRLNAVVISADGASLILNHGSRTDHGEVQDYDGAAPDLREIPLTSALLRVPIDADDLLLPNDADALLAGGYLLADGFRNAFDLAYDADGRLYAAENAGDRDDGDELNWIQEGRHYGFPWRMGTNDTPQQFPGYDPDADPLLNPLAGGIQLGAFYDDPDYPAPPPGVVFTDPVLNVGPDADGFRAPDGSIRDASDDGVAASTFTPHRSPLGLVFDTDGELPAPFTRDGFVLSWTDGSPGDDGVSPLLEPFGDPSEDVLHLTFSDPETVSARRIVGGFANPIDVVQRGRTLLVAEFGGDNGLWAVRFTGLVTTEPGAEAVRSFRVGPSPFRGRAQVSLTLDRPADIRAEVFDALGRRVARLHDGPLAAGPHAFALDGGRLPSGSYVVRVIGPDGTATRSLVRVR